MKLKNISIGDFIEAKNKHGGAVGLDVLEIGKSYEVLGFNEDNDLTVIISVPYHNVFSDGFCVCHECFRKPQLKQLDQSIFDGLNERWRFAAVDSDGAAFAFISKPENRGIFWNNSDRNQFTRRSGKGDYDTSNWQNSLIERDVAEEPLEVDLSGELTGSDLARAMLARGDKYVSGFGHHKSDDGAVYSTFADTVTRYSHCFHSAQNSWDYFVPINNQGEPLTQAEAGL